MAAITARNVRYWKTRKKPSSGDPAAIGPVQAAWVPSSARRPAQGLDHALHLHEARALDGTLAQVLRAHGRLQALDVVEMAAAKGHGRVDGQRASASSCSMPRARIGADLGVEGRPLVAHLAHVAQHQQARAGQLGQHVDGGAHRIGVGVVGVVDQRERAAPAQRTVRERP
jgi:hypothetical protein